MTATVSPPSSLRRSPRPVVAVRPRSRPRRDPADRGRAKPHRLSSEAAFARLCGAVPLPASSGKDHRHRLNSGGTRGANNALWTIAMVRLRYDERTRAYRDRRTTGGETPREIIRWLKRYIARQVYRVILADLAPDRPLLQLVPRAT